MFKQTVNHNGVKATIKTGDCGYDVFVGGQKIGAFVFSDSRNGYAGFSNSYGIDCYQLIEIGGKTVWGTGPLHSSKRSACKDVVERAQKAEII